MSRTIKESGLCFGPFEETALFEFERSPGIALLGSGIKKVEFALSQGKNKQIVFVEAKSSIPRETDAFFSAVKIKLVHSLTLWMLGLTRRHPELFGELPEGLNRRIDATRPLAFLLVIPGMPDHALAPATDKLRRTLDADLRLWNIPAQNVRVLNESKASHIGLCSGTAPCAA